MLKPPHDLDLSLHGPAILLSRGVDHLRGERETSLFFLASVDCAELSSVKRKNVSCLETQSRKGSEIFWTSARLSGRRLRSISGGGGLRKISDTLDFVVADSPL